MKYFKSIISILLLLGFFSCKEEFLDKPALGSLSEDVLATQEGVDALLVGAYGALDGQNLGAGTWSAAADNWIYGSIAGGDAHKGSDGGDQPNINPIERYEADASNGFFNDKWKAMYEGISRCNSTITVLDKVEDINDKAQTRILGEAMFLRGHYYFELKRFFNKVPWIDETTEDIKQPNTADIWSMIEEQFKSAMANLPEVQITTGRANKSAAEAYLAKVYMYQKKYAEAKPLLENLIANGMTASGEPYALLSGYSMNFNPEFENGPESVFAVQFSANDGSGGIENSRQGSMLNFPYTKWCCGFFQPSYDLVNSYRTSDQGLPYLSNYNQFPVKNDLGINSDEPFTLDDEPLDPRLDWTIGRRGIPYLGHGDHPGQRWIRDQTYAGPYSPKKNVFRESQQDWAFDAGSWAPGTAINYEIIRFADIILWAAEVEIETGSLDKAREYVNMIRERASNSDDFVKREDGSDAANYVVGAYDASWTDQQTARDVVRFERKLEFGMEGRRFFDLVRWGIADQAINDYIASESENIIYLKGATFTSNKNEYYPIPQRQIDLSTKESEPTLTQNPGYN